MTLFYDPTGPLVHYADGTLTVADLNPEAEIRFVMSRWELFRLGLRAIRVALLGTEES